MKVSEEQIIRYCSPTLAGIKAGSVFNFFFCNYELLEREFHSVNIKLRHKGVTVIPLKVTGGRALVYVYRPKMLASVLVDADARRLLDTFGYDDFGLRHLILHLARRLSENRDFPHEIGLFLGYPPADVLGFIENQAENYEICGYWKVYHNADKAERLFARYKKCTEIYMNMYSKGTDLLRLTVSVF